MSDLEKIAKKMDTVLTGITATQERLETVEGKADALDKLAIEKMAKESGDAMQAIQDIQQKQNALQASQDLMMKQATRLSTGESSDDTEKKFKEEMSAYLRKGTHITDDSINDIAKVLVNKHLNGLTDSEKEMQTKTLAAGSNPDGGYWVRPEVSNKIITRIYETSPVRLVADVMPTSSDSVEMIIDDNEFVSGGWVSEQGARSETATGKIGQLTIPIHEQYAEPRATQKIIDDAGFDIEAYVMNKATDILTRTENTSFVAGDGGGKPKGFLSYSAWTTNGTYERNKLEQIVSGAAGAFTGDGVISLQNALKEEFQSNAVFMIQRASWEKILQLKNGIGNYLLNPNMIRESADKILLGKRVIFANDIPAIASDALAMVYGDFRMGYSIFDRVGIRVLRDPYTAKPYIKFYVTKRVGGAVTNYEALKIQKLAAS